MFIKQVIITHPPQYGTIDREVLNPNAIGNSGGRKTSSATGVDEPKIDDQVISIDTSTNQKLNFILKFNNLNSNNSSNSNTKTNYVTVNEFSMSDIANGLISYKHRSPGSRQDRFGFIVYDGFNNMFTVESGQQVSSYQVFSIDIGGSSSSSISDSVTGSSSAVNNNGGLNQAPVLDKCLGLDYLYQIDGQPGRLITKNELLIVDKDDPDSELSVEVTRKPSYGTLEHKDRPGVPLFRFTQQDINANKIYYLLRHMDDKLGVYEDFFEFDVRDSSSETRLTRNRFE